MGYYRGATTVLLVLLALISLVSETLATDTVGLKELDSKLIQGPALPDFVAHAYQTNPSIQAAREDWKAVIERYRVVTSYPDPEIMFETRPGPKEWSVNLSQMIPFPGKLSKAGELVMVDARIARLELDKTIRDVIVQIRESYFELLYLRDAKRVVAQNRNLLDHLRKVGETAYAKDKATLVDVLKAQSQSAQLQYDALLLEELERTEKTRLNSLLNRPPQAVIGPLKDEPLRPLIYPLDEIYLLAGKYQEEILMAESKIERARAMVDLARYENLPEFKLGLFYMREETSDTSMGSKDERWNDVGIQAGITIPLWSGKNAGRLGEARAEVNKAKSMKAAQLNETFAQIRNLYFRLQNAERLIRLYKDKLLPQAASSMEIAETWYREGQGSFSDFVETEAVYYNFQLALTRAKADYGKFLAGLEKLTGRSLTEKVSGLNEGKNEGGSK